MRLWFSKKLSFVFLAIFTLAPAYTLNLNAAENAPPTSIEEKNETPEQTPETKKEGDPNQAPPPPVCEKASPAQLKIVQKGNKKKDKFLTRCARETGSSPLCLELVRPNPIKESVDAFHCTYGEDMPHQLIHPDETTWKNPIEAVRILHELEKIGIRNCGIYNWWRPEPYNKNVKGSPRRHPFGVSVDVLFCTKTDADRAFLELCKMKEAGRIKAIGFYGNNNLHLGVGDAKANNWGKYCVEVLPPKKPEEPPKSPDLPAGDDKKANPQEPGRPDQTQKPPSTKPSPAH